MVDVNPPINERTTEQLIEMVEARERWRKEVLEAASEELELRGISLDEQAHRYRNKRVRDSNFKRRTSRIKGNATYSATEKILIILFGPILMILLEDFSLFHSGQGYKRKNRQGWFYLILGIGLWALVGYFSFRY